MTQHWRSRLRALAWEPRGTMVALLLAIAIPTIASAQAEPPPGPTPDQLERRRPTLPPAEPALPPFSINGALRGGVQWIATGDKTSQTVFGTGSLDLNVVVRPTDFARLFLDVEGLLGPGPDHDLGT